MDELDEMIQEQEQTLIALYAAKYKKAANIPNISSSGILVLLEVAIDVFLQLIDILKAGQSPVRHNSGIFFSDVYVDTINNPLQRKISSSGMPIWDPEIASILTKMLTYLLELRKMMILPFVQEDQVTRSLVEIELLKELLPTFLRKLHKRNKYREVLSVVLSESQTLLRQWGYLLW
jgi:hypothetical protein